MTTINMNDYQRAFRIYLRKGIPIGCTLKAEKRTEGYVWRTTGDDKVRLEHRRNEGRRFSWDTPPATGHPGKDFNCRCLAEPYIRGRTEFVEHDFGDSLEGNAPVPWTSLEMWRRSRGAGLGVSLREIGHLERIVDQWSYLDGEGGALARLSEQIIVSARLATDGTFQRSFSGSYDFGDVAYAHGGSTIQGQYVGTAFQRGDQIIVYAEVEFNFSDEFTDPYRLRQWFNETSDPSAVSDTWRRISDFGGHVYRISDHWRTTFQAEAIVDENESIYKNQYDWKE